jgi:1,4-dihydroxy-2-naphthoate octaprenyltransferase
LLLISIFFVPVLVYFIWWFMQVHRNNEAANFKNAMRMNWIAAFCTNLAFISLLIWKWFE